MTKQQEDKMYDACREQVAFCVRNNIKVDFQKDNLFSPYVPLVDRLRI